MIHTGGQLARALGYALALAAVIACGCAGADCDPGEVVACSCSEGGSAKVVCDDDGTLPPCLCGAAGSDAGEGELGWSKDASVVTDAKHGWMWQRTPMPTTMAWEAAKIACEDLVLAGYDDWLLPHKDDLLTIVLKSTTTPAIDEAAFPNTPAKPFWTRTLYAPQSKTHAWGVDFEDGGEGYAPFVEHHYVRCVRAWSP